MKNIAIILSGCGVFDGAEIHESVLTLLALDELGASYRIFAPDVEQMHVINHLTGEVATGASRNVLVEAARIARGEIQDVRHANVSDFDAAILPGGFGAAKNLSDFAVKGSSCIVNPELQGFLSAMHQSAKPLGFICIAPAMIPKIVSDKPILTIGNDPEAASNIGQMGGVHQECNVDEIVVDERHKIVSTPAYMLANSIGEAALGIRKLVKQVYAMA